MALGEACRTNVCFSGSTLVGVASLEDFCPPGFVTAAVVRLVTTVCFLPLGSVQVSLSLLASFRSAVFLPAITVWPLVLKDAVASPVSMDRKSILVRPDAAGTYVYTGTEL